VSLHTLMGLLHHVPPQNLLASIDVINELLMVPRAKKAFQANFEDAKQSAISAAKMVLTHVDKRAAVKNGKGLALPCRSFL
jgi:hypothetical protein